VDVRGLTGNTAAVHDPMAFTDPENWTGGFYELSLEIGDRDDDRLQRALTALWGAAAITGCYRRRDREPADQVAAPVTVASLQEFGHLHGIARTPLGGSVVCGCFSTRFDDAEDWLTLYLPLGALTRADPRVGFEVDHTTAAELGGEVPGQRWNGYLLPVDGQLSYTPANH
jgi:hypothetical protein